MTEYIFYKISCIDKNINYIYIGSTKNFRCRKNQHKYAVTNEASKSYTMPLYKTIRENGGWDNWRIDPIGKGIFENKVDALIEEQKYINDNNTTLNSNKAHMTKDDRYNYMKQHYETHKKEYKEHYETHKEEIKEIHKKYRETHKEEIKEKTTCECGGCYTYSHKARHFRTKRHIDHFS
jgi:hypothetical protein